MKFPFAFALITAMLFVQVLLPGCKEKDDAVELCANGIDDDKDGFIDLQDNDCTETGNECANGKDDDDDGFIDNADLDCTETGSECANGIDDDGDGFIDCFDLDCDGEPNC